MTLCNFHDKAHLSWLCTEDPFDNSTLSISWVSSLAILPQFLWSSCISFPFPKTCAFLCTGPMFWEHSQISSPPSPASAPSLVSWDYFIHDSYHVGLSFPYQPQLCGNRFHNTLFYVPLESQSMGSLRVGHNWATSLSLFTCMRWRRKWQLIQCSCLEDPKDGRAWWAAVYGVAQSRTWLKRLSSSSRISYGYLLNKLKYLAT